MFVFTKTMLSRFLHSYCMCFAGSRIQVTKETTKAGSQVWTINPILLALNFWTQWQCVCEPMKCAHKEKTEWSNFPSLVGIDGGFKCQNVPEKVHLKSDSFKCFKRLSCWPWTFNSAHTIEFFCPLYCLSSEEQNKLRKKLPSVKIEPVISCGSLWCLPNWANLASEGYLTPH